MNIQAYASRSEQAEALAMWVADQLHVALVGRGDARLAVPGGTTPAPFLQALGRTRLDWHKVRVTLTDERQVPPDNARSNALLLQQNLLQAVPGAVFLPLFGHGGEWLDTVAQALQSDFLPLDVCVLGMGADGHFASLFPGADQLQAGLDISNPAAVMEITAGDIPEARVSLTLSALLSARHIHLLITGDEKKQVLEQAQANVAAGAGHGLPVGALLQHAGGRLTIHYAP